MTAWRASRLVLCAIVAVASSGCSNSVPVRMARAVSGNAPSTGPVKNDRLLAIGQMFEQQGNYNKATRMYRLVLSRQPANKQAADRLVQIAALRENEGKVFEQNTGTSIAAKQNTTTPQTVAASGGQAAGVASTGSPQPQQIPVQTVTASREVPPAPAPVIVESGGTDTAPAPVAVPEQTATPVAPTSEQPTETTTPSTAPQVIPVAPQAATTGTVPTVTPSQWSQTRPRPTTTTSDASGQKFHMPEVAASQAAQTPSTTLDLTGLEACIDNPAAHLETLVPALADSNPDVRSLAAFLVGESGAEAIRAMPLLEARLSVEPLDVVRVTVAEAIGKIDNSNQDARRVLLQTITSSDAQTRSQSAFALRVFARVADEQTVAALEQALSDSNSDVSAMAALSLSDFGASAQVALPALQTAMQSASPTAQEALQAAIERISEDAGVQPASFKK